MVIIRITARWNGGIFRAEERHHRRAVQWVALRAELARECAALGMTDVQISYRVEQ